MRRVKARQELWIGILWEPGATLLNVTNMQSEAEKWEQANMGAQTAHLNKGDILNFERAEPGEDVYPMAVRDWPAAFEFTEEPDGKVVVEFYPPDKI